MHAFAKVLIMTGLGLSIASDVGAQESLWQNLIAQHEMIAKQGQHLEAAEVAEVAVVVAEKTFGPQDLHSVQSLELLAKSCSAQGHHAKARRLYQQALALREAALGPQHPTVATTMLLLADFYASQGQPDQAEPLYKLALATRELAFGADHLTVATSSILLAKFYDSTGGDFQAERLYQRGLSIFANSFPSAVETRPEVTVRDAVQDQPVKPQSAERQTLVQVAASLQNRAIAYGGLGIYNEARSLFEQSLEAYEQALGPNHPDLIGVLEDYAALLRRTGNTSQAALLEGRAGRIRSMR